MTWSRSFGVGLPGLDNPQGRRGALPGSRPGPEGTRPMIFPVGFVSPPGLGLLGLGQSQAPVGPKSEASFQRGRRHPLTARSAYDNAKYV